MDRPWNITEQVIEDPTTKLRIEFTSVHTDETAKGNPAPLHDQIIYLRLWTSDRTRVATYAFTRGGRFIKTAVEHVDPGIHPKLEDGIAHAKTGKPIIPPGETRVPPEEKEQGALAPHDSGGGQAPEESKEFGNINYAEQFAGDI